MKKYKLPHRLSQDPSPLLPNFPFLYFFLFSSFLFFSFCSILPLLCTLKTGLCISSDFCWFSDAWVELSPPQRLPLGVPIKTAIMEKQKARGGTMGRGKRREPLFLTSLSLSPSHRTPRAFFFSPASLRHREQRRERVDKNWCGVAAKAPGTSQKWRVYELIC